jgi:hypothetical protein
MARSNAAHDLQPARRANLAMAAAVRSGRSEPKAAGRCLPAQVEMAWVEHGVGSLFYAKS